MGVYRFFIFFFEWVFYDLILMYKKGQMQVGVVLLFEKIGYVFIIWLYDVDCMDDEDICFEWVKDLLYGFLGVKFVIENMLKEYFVLFYKIEQMVVKELWYRGCVVLGGDVVYVGVLMVIEDVIVFSEEL